MARPVNVYSIVLLSIFCTNVFAQEIALPAKGKFHLFLLIGQSNMAGRGIVEAQDETPHPRVLMLNKNGRWKPAIDPLHFDKAAAGVGIGKTFGQVIADGNKDVTIGLIPCAVGGSPIDTWKPGVYYSATKSHPWDDAIERATIAMESGELKGILWHQGESDSSTLALAEGYEAKLHDLIRRLRMSLDAPNVPFIAGQLGQFPGAPWSESRKIVNIAHQSLPSKIAQTGFVPSDGLQHKGDKVHFDAKSCREFGKRYAKTWSSL